MAKEYQPQSFPIFVNEGESISCAPPDKTGLPRDFETIVAHFAYRGFSDPAEAAKTFCIHWAMCGWRYNGNYINWYFAALKWRDKYKQNNAQANYRDKFEKSIYKE